MSKISKCQLVSKFWYSEFIKGSWIGLTLVTYNVTFMKTVNIDFYELVSVKQITDFWMRTVCMNFSRQVKWGPHIEMGGRSLDGRRALSHSNRFDSEKFHLLLLPIIASMRKTGMATICKQWQEWEILTNDLNICIYAGGCWEKGQLNQNLQNQHSRRQNQSI